MSEDLVDNTSFPIMYLAALAFVIVMGGMYLGGMLVNLSHDTGIETGPLSIFTQSHMFIISIIAMILVSVIILGLQIAKDKVLQHP